MVGFLNERIEASFCVAQRSAAEENGVSMLREGGHRPRDARAFLSVCGTHSDITKIDHKAHTIHTKERTPVVHLTLGHFMHSERVPRLTQGRERATTAVSKNKLGPSSRAAQAPPFFKGCGNRERCQFHLLWKDRIRRI